MPNVLRFGIHSLDELLGVPGGKDAKKPAGKLLPGIYLPGENDGSAGEEAFTTSVCIVGPNGSGKSIFGLHMASTYLGDCMGDYLDGEIDENRIPAVLYISTDLTYNMANRVWSKFALDRPFSRKDPFGPTNLRPSPRPEQIRLKQCNPTTLAEDVDLIFAEGPGLMEAKRGVIFLDIASYTAGDDWGFLHKLLSLLPKPATQAPGHLVVIDAIEGFEALAGELNAFGEKSTRRARVAQVMRLAAGKCHVLLVVEESKHHERLAEEFIADTVIRLENISTRNYYRRVLKIEKARGQSHIRGQHHYSIRSGRGSTTGNQVNADDPEILSLRISDGSQSYIQVFHSIHRLNRKIMEVKGKARKKLEPNKYYAAFGIKYLDNMLGGSGDTRGVSSLFDAGPGLEKTLYYYDTRGLPCRSTTALIGDSLTQKSTLGKAFLCRCFQSFDERLARIHRLLKDHGSVKAAHKIWELVTRKVNMLSEQPIDMSEYWRDRAKSHIKEGNWVDLLRLLVVKTEIRREHLPFRLQGGFPGAKKNELKRLLGDAELKQSSDIEQLSERELDQHLEEARLTHLAAWLLDYQSGLAVMLTTHNTHSERLTEEFISWLYSEDKLKSRGESMKGYKKALENYIKGGTICRRLEIHSLSSEILIHIVQQVIKAAQRKILTAEQMQSEQSDEIRYEKSWPIRVVIDDFSTFRDIFPELHEDPLLLPTILFHFEREGVTTLILDTQSGKPDTPIAERFESELRKLVQHNLYTWRVPFYGESRVAITAIPPFSYEYAGIVRELRWESEAPRQQNPHLTNEPAIVDPHFELYTGLEEGKPQSVPLCVHFYVETPAMQSYIELENNFLKELFIAPADASRAGAGSVIVGVPATNYNELRDLAYLTRDTRLDYTLLFQVDEFWVMRAPKRHKRAGAFQPQRSYLNAITATIKDEAEKTGRKEGETKNHQQYEPDPDTDPYQLFQRRGEDPNHEAPAEPLRRKHFYETYYEDFAEYKTLGHEHDEIQIDRVPFTWDFGFLLCQQRAWDTGRTFKAPKIVKKDQGGELVEEEETYSIQRVWRSLVKANKGLERGGRAGEKDDKKLDYVSWRIFIEACKKAAEAVSSRLSKPVTAFDFAQISPESFSCLILEMWFSEIYDTLHLKAEAQESSEERRRESKEKLEKFLATVSNRRLSVETPGRGMVTLYSLLKDYWLELYKTWLLLIEVLNFSDILGEATAFNFDFKSKNTDFSAVASRHWYKTASQCPDEIAATEPLVAARLPGRFSVRGDWFLAVSGSSRSIRQAERAMDLLNSRRANVTRLQLGLGLPTRFSRKESTDRLRTKLISHERGQDNVEYGTFLNIAANKGNDGGEKFFWLWRSSLSDYTHSNRIWHKWLNRVLLSWHRNLLRYKSVWKNSFTVYDDLTNYSYQKIEEFAPTITELDAKQSELEKVREKSEKKFNEDRRAYMDKFEGKFDRFGERLLGSSKNIESLAQLKVRADFRNLLEVLIKELEQASETTQRG